MYIYVYTYIHTNKHTWIHTYIHRLLEATSLIFYDGIMYMYMYIYIYIYIYRVYIYIYVYIHTYKQTYMYTYLHTQVVGGDVADLLRRLGVDDVLGLDERPELAIVPKFSFQEVQQKILVGPCMCLCVYVYVFVYVCPYICMHI